MAFMASPKAQLPVSTSPQNKKMILEEYTGVYCSFCPEGHLFAKQIYTANPTNVIVVNIHPPNLFGIPKQPGDIDLRTQDGIIIHNAFGINSYPSGAINRTPIFGPIATTRYNWAAGANTITSQPAYCNVALQGTINVSTRVLTVQAQVYYTGNSPKPTNYLTVMLCESNIPARQANGMFYNPTNFNPDGTYIHDHALRKVLTNPFGDAIATTTTGYTYNITLTYTVPQKYGVTPYDYNCLLGRLELVAFVTQETQSITINGARGPLTLTGFTNSTDIGTEQVKNDAQVCAAKLNSSFKFVNYGSSTVTSAVFSYSTNGVAAPNYSWTGSVNPFTQSQTINLPVATFVSNATNNLDISVVSVNGLPDQNSANNLSSVNSIPQTTIYAPSNSMQMVFVHDQYGNESQWKVYDESTNNLIASDGPFTNLGSSGTATVTKNFSLTPNTCYKLVVTDDSENGINTSYGSGYYRLNSGASTIYTSTGTYYDRETIWFTSANIMGLESKALNVLSIKLMPNPASTEVSINIEMNQTEKGDVEAVNNLGQIILRDHLNCNAGSNSYKINTANWSNGVYHVKLITPHGTEVQKLIIAK